MKFFLLLLVLAGALAWLALGRRKPPPPPPVGPAKAPKVAAPQAMVSCAHCGVHLPASDALRDDAGRHYCGEAHRQAGPRSAG